MAAVSNCVPDVDAEAGANTALQVNRPSVASAPNDTVEFEGRDDPAHPFNWSLPLKHAAFSRSLGVVCVLTHGRPLRLRVSVSLGFATFTVGLTPRSSHRQSMH
ncbi:hypothetical protein BDV09DRAFT_177195 [Aspergillus tetrazonus]